MTDTTNDIGGSDPDQIDVGTFFVLSSDEIADSVRSSSVEGPCGHSPEGRCRSRSRSRSPSPAKDAAPDAAADAARDAAAEAAPEPPPAVEAESPPVPVGTETRAWDREEKKFRRGTISGARRLVSGEHVYDVFITKMSLCLRDRRIHELRHPTDMSHEPPPGVDDSKKSKALSLPCFHVVHICADSGSRTFEGPGPWRQLQPLIVGYVFPRAGPWKIQNGNWKQTCNCHTKSALHTFLGKHVDLVQHWHEHLKPDVFKLSKRKVIAQFQAPSHVAHISALQNYDMEHKYYKWADTECYEVHYYGHCEHEPNWAMDGIEAGEAMGFKLKFELPPLRETPYYKPE